MSGVYMGRVLCRRRWYWIWRWLFVLFSLARVLSFQTPFFYLKISQTLLTPTGNNATLVQANVGGSTFGPRNKYGCVVNSSTKVKAWLCCKSQPAWVSSSWAWSGIGRKANVSRMNMGFPPRRRHVWTMESCQSKRGIKLGGLEFW